MTEPLTPEQMARDVAERIFHDMCEGDGQHSEALDLSIITGHVLSALATERTRREALEREASVLRGTPIAFLHKQIATRDTQLAVVTAALREAAPYVCPECGPHVKVDEDECCASCGADAALHAQPATPTDAGRLDHAYLGAGVLTDEQRARLMAGEDPRTVAPGGVFLPIPATPTPTIETCADCAVGYPCGVHGMDDTVA